jgi:hypothetical protein
LVCGTTTAARSLLLGEPFLADTIRHIANALEEQYGHSKPDTIAAILESLHNELDDPTSHVTSWI